MNGDDHRYQVESRLLATIGEISHVTYNGHYVCALGRVRN